MHLFVDPRLASRGPAGPNKNNDPAEGEGTEGLSWEMGTEGISWEMGTEGLSWEMGTEGIN